MPFYRISEMEAVRASVSPATAKTAPGELMKVGFVTYPKGKVSRPHYHPNEEQFLLILEGRQWMIVGDEERVVEPGDLVHIPRNTRHGGVIIDDELRMFTAKSPSGDGRLDQDHNDAEDAEAIVRRLEEKLREFTP